MPPSPHSRTTLSNRRASPTVSVVLPALNEEHNLPLVLEGLPDLVDEVVVVDGGSIDDTVAIAREVRPDVVVVRQTRSGKGNALVCGLAAATGDIVVTLNADGSTDPGEIPRYVDALLAGAEVAHGSRYRAGGGIFAGSRWEDLGNRGLNTIVNILFGTSFTDLAFGYNAFWRSLLPALDLPEAHEPGARRGTAVWGDGPEIEPLMTIRMAAQGLRVVEVASIGYPRIHGAAPRSRLRAGVRALKTVAAEWMRHHRANQTVAGRHGADPGQRADTWRGGTATRHPAPAPARGTRAWPEAAGPMPSWPDILPAGLHDDPPGTADDRAGHAGRDDRAGHARRDDRAGHARRDDRAAWNDVQARRGGDDDTDTGRHRLVRHRPTGSPYFQDGDANPAAGPGRAPGGRAGGGRHAAPTDEDDASLRGGIPSQRDARWDGPAGMAPDARRPGERRQGADRHGPGNRRPGGGGLNGEARSRPELTMIAGTGTDESPVAWLAPGPRPTHLRAVSGEPRWG